jgi:hypothetical protein
LRISGFFNAGDGHENRQDKYRKPHGHLPNAACHACVPVVSKAASGKNGMMLGVGAISMDDHPHATDNALDQAERELLISTVSDEALEKVAGCTSWAQTYPGTGVATVCVPDSPFPKKLGSQVAHAR